MGTTNQHITGKRGSKQGNYFNLSNFQKLQNYYLHKKKQQITNFQIKHGNIAKLQFHKFISTKYETPEDIVFLGNLILSPKSKFAARHKHHENFFSCTKCEITV